MEVHIKCITVIHLITPSGSTTRLGQSPQTVPRGSLETSLCSDGAIASRFLPSAFYILPSAFRHAPPGVRPSSVRSAIFVETKTKEAPAPQEAVWQPLSHGFNTD